MTVFANTFALIAWLNPDDDAHAHTAAYLGNFTGRLFTTEWVLLELADAMSSPMARSRDFEPCLNSRIASEGKPLND